MTDRRHRARTAAVLCLTIGFAPGASSALAAPDPTPSPTATATAPTQDQVDKAKQAVTEAGARQEALQAELVSARARLDAVTTKAALATEAYNAARVRLAQRTAAAEKATTEAAQARAAAGQAQAHLDDLAAQLYMQGGTLNGLAQLFAGGTGDMARRAADVDAVSGFRHRTLTSAADAATRAAASRRAAAAAQLQQKAAATQAQETFEAAKAEASAAAAAEVRLSAREEALLTELAQLRGTSVALETERQTVLAADEARRAAQARAAEPAQQERAAQAAPEAVPGSSGADTAQLSEATASSDPLPAPQRAAATTAIEFAKQQLGEPYLWAAEGPSSWDCSGLTLKAWAAGGRSLTHYSVAQYQETQRVAIADLQPGDLVFFGGSPATIHHVGLYVGNGQMIEAPRAGLDVRYSSIYRSSLLPYGGRV